MFFHKDKKPAGNPAWLKWLVMLFIGYAIFVNYTERKERPSVLGATQNQEANDTFSKADFGQYILPSGITIGGDVEGSGEDARCGQTAILIYDEVLPEHATERGVIDHHMTLHVGLNDGSTPWAVAIPGMMPEGVRNIKVLAGKRYNEDELSRLGLNANDTINYKIEMLEVKPASDPDHIRFQATDRVVGHGETVSCGLIADVHVTLWAPDGTQRFDTRTYKDGTPLSLRVGESTYFYGLDRGLLHMRKYGQRTLIIPPAYATLTEKEDNPFTGVISPDEMVIAEVTVLDVRWE